jgi:hypothetical protein
MMTGKTEAVRKPRSWVDVLTVVVLLATVGLLLESRLERRDAARRARDQLQQMNEAAPKPGTILPAFAVVDSVGERAMLLGSGEPRRRLLFIFKTDCPVCGEQKPEWMEIAELARRTGWEVDALTSEPMTPWVRSYFAASAVNVLQLENPAEAGRSLGARVVPITVLLDKGGRVLSYDMGRLSPARSDSLKARLRNGAPGRTTLGG